MIEWFLFIGAVGLGLYFLFQKIETEKEEDFEDRDN
jgi:hypothetical protein